MYTLDKPNYARYIAGFFVRCAMSPAIVQCAVCRDDLQQHRADSRPVSAASVGHAGRLSSLGTVRRTAWILLSQTRAFNCGYSVMTVSRRIIVVTVVGDVVGQKNYEAAKSSNFPTDGRKCLR